MKLIIYFIVIFTSFTSVQASESCAHIPAALNPVISFCQANNYYTYEHKKLNIKWTEEKLIVENYLKKQIKRITFGTAFPEIDWSKTKIEGWLSANDESSDGHFVFIVKNKFASFQFDLNQNINLWPKELKLEDVRINMRSSTPSSQAYAPKKFVSLLTPLGDLKYKETEKFLKSMGATEISFKVVFPMVFFKAGIGFDEKEIIKKISKTKEYELFFESMGINLILKHFSIEKKAFEF